MEILDEENSRQWCLFDNKDNYYLTPKGTTRSGSHPNVVFMSAPAYDIDAAKRYFQNTRCVDVKCQRSCLTNKFT